MRTDRAAEVMTVSQLVEELASILRAASVAQAFSEARDIVAALYDVPRFWPLINGAVIVDGPIRDRAYRAAEARAAGAPFAYAVGRAAFRRLTLDVDQRVLIPRPETEHLVDLVLDEIVDLSNAIAVDVGTGSGAIAIALATEAGERFSKIYGTDISRDAADVARANVSAASAMLKAPMEIIHGSLLSPLAGKQVHVVVSNPPYIALGEASALPASVRDWEPAPALFSGADGMTATRQLVHQAADLLAPGGLFAIEVDVRRASLAAELVSRERRFESIRVELDLTGRERFVLARRQEQREERDE